ncbi:MBOAT family O-acyltransferase [Parablautia muri]|uniref:MBOAT family protein n=1 Tax=Parablautia muri TaxID=2320879 RepID=A0A9X5BCN6_9FIRM|nr:MBOAT family O-acyltransferase [Parablautia muri]NBJ91293.1 MBOAT family protein [Parablautia muri]
MLFNSYIFIFLFFPLTLIGYYGLNYAKKYNLALAFLIGMSMWFYGYNNIYYLAILIVSISINYGLITGMASVSAKRLKRLFLWAGVFLNIGILFYFKYYDFFIDNINSALKAEFPLLKLILPLGISFYTFQQLSCVIDSYKGECEHYSFLEYALYVSFFPQLIAGPIVYHNELIPQFQDIGNRKINFENLSRGIYAFALGLAKKVLIADTFSSIVTIGYNNITALNTTSVILVTVCYSLQLYFDFSGYCDMAYGMGYMLNVKLPANFNSPYKAESFADLWNRWHMTLTRFFIKYVYIPLGGSRRGKARTYLNTLIVFIVSGLWHGANWTFILWGTLNGIVIIIERFTKLASLKIPKIIKMVTTYSLFTFTCSLFRSASVKDAGILWIRLFCGGFGPVYQPLIDAFGDLTESKFLYRAGFGAIMTNYPWLMLTVFTAIALAACFTLKNTQEKVAELTLSNRKFFVVVILMIWSIISLSGISEFLYFNF